MLVQEVRHVPDLGVDDDPAVILGVVAADVGQAQRPRRHDYKATNHRKAIFSETEESEYAHVGVISKRFCGPRWAPERERGSRARGRHPASLVRLLLPARSPVLRLVTNSGQWEAGLGLLYCDGVSGRL